MNTRLLCHVMVFLTVSTFATAASAQTAVPQTPGGQTYDVVIYGGTSAAVTAAVQARHMGKSAVVIEPGRHIGGLTSGGLGATDIGNKAAIGGLSRSFYGRLGDYYAREEAWVQQTRDSYRSRRQTGAEKEMLTFEPHVAEEVFLAMLKEVEVPIVFGERLDLAKGVVKNGARITAIRMESGKEFRGKMFIDATYEGDLMAKAGVAYHVGREANAVYGETLNGVQTQNAVHHQFIVTLDPYIVPGDASSGLLPGIREGHPEPDGTGDHKVQAYCFRMCMTDAPMNRRPWPKPAGYDPLRYELLLRNFEAGDHRVPWSPSPMPNCKTDTNNNFAVSTDNIGMNYDYPDGDYATREKIIKEHELYQQGLMWTLANNPRVPKDVQAVFVNFGLSRDEFVDNDNWPHQLYVREARRMISDYVMTQHDCQGRREATDSVGLAAYTMDSHNIQRYYKDGRVLNEGDVQVGGFSPYPIAYRSLRPQKAECTNLLVPVCLSASHIAYGSIRMEPVFMVLGQSAATAACQAIEEKSAVQDIDLAAFKKRLVADGQVLAWTGPKRKPPVDPASLPGIVLDDRQAELKGPWSTSSSIAMFVGNHYLHDGNLMKGKMQAVFRPKIEKSGRYEVRIAYTANPNRASNVPVTIVVGGGDQQKHVVKVNQKLRPKFGAFAKIGEFMFNAGNDSSVTISNADTDGHVIVDAVQLLPVH